MFVPRLCSVCSLASSSAIQSESVVPCCPASYLASPIDDDDWFLISIVVVSMLCALSLESSFGCMLLQCIVVGVCVAFCCGSLA